MGNSDATCGLPSDWRDLAVRAGIAADSKGLPRPTLRRELETRLARLDLNTLFKTIDQIQSRSLRLRVESVLDDLDRFVMSGQLATPWVMALDLEEIDNIVAEYCGTRDQNVPPMPSSFPALASRFQEVWQGDRPPELVDYVMLALLPALAAAVTGMLLLLNQVVAWCRTLRNARKSCLIPAVLSIGTYSVPGTITVLGRKGCRFVGTDQKARDLLGDIAESGSTSVIAEGIRIPANVVGHQPTHVAVLFQMDLPKPFLDLLLGASTQPPRFARYRPVRRNVPQRPGQRARPAVLVGSDHDEDLGGPDIRPAPHGPRGRIKTS